MSCLTQIFVFKISLYFFSTSSLFNSYVNFGWRVWTTRRAMRSEPKIKESLWNEYAIFGFWWIFKFVLFGNEFWKEIWWVCVILMKRELWDGKNGRSNKGRWNWRFLCYWIFMEDLEKILYFPRIMENLEYSNVF